MRSHAKAPSSGSTPIRSEHRSRAGIKLAYLLVLACSVLLLAVAPASAVEINKRPLLFSFDGADTTAGKFSSANAIEIDQATGTVYVLDSGNHGVVDRFDQEGKAQPYPGLLGNQSSLKPNLDLKFNGLAGLAVDNYGPNPGRIYAQRENGGVEAFTAAGAALWQLGGLSEACGMAVDTEGHPWVGDYAVGSRRYANTGSPPAQLGVVATPEVCRLDIDAAGNVYSVRWNGAVEKFEENGAKKTTINAGSNAGVAVDQTSPAGHVFVLHNNSSFSEYDASGAKTGTYPGGGSDIAYLSALDRVYISTGSKVDVYGAPEIGDAPAVAMDPASGVGLIKATLNGKVDPDSLPDVSYRFEWRPVGSSIWTTSPQQDLPASDGEIAISHQVTEFKNDATLKFEALKSDTEYEARLVGVNDESKFTLVSDPIKFNTSMPAAPTVAIDEPTHSAFAATVTATIDPMGDTTTWQVQKSNDPACATGFVNEPLQVIPGGEPGSVAVERKLVGILPAKHYCVRIVAFNGNKTEVGPGQKETTVVTSATKEFTTESIVPLATTAFVAPRTDTTVRLNGRVNPNGLDLTYRFEWSDDGGATWNAFPDREDTSESYDQFTVSEELSGLSPSTTYQYRFTAENAVGEASPQGVVKSFTTRSSAEMNLPARGIELVNNPDKGNQHVNTLPILDEEDSLISSQDALTGDGKHAGWTVSASAPGATIGSGNPFLATRTANGWTSRSLIPKAEEQAGGGNLKFNFIALSPDLNRSIFVSDEGVFTTPDSWIVRNVGEEQEILASFPSAEVDTPDTTTDVAHVITMSPTTKELTDFGSGTPDVVGLMDDDQPPACGIDAFRGLDEPHWIATTDASRVYFLSRGHTCADPVGLYVRNRDDGTTTLLSRNAQFLRTSADGRTTLFVTPQALVGEDANTGNDVYRWSEDDGAKCLSCVVADAKAGGPFFTSHDLSRIYFRSASQLVPGEGKAGASNLYVLRDDGSLDFIALVKTEGNSMSRLSADGEVFAFSSTIEPTVDQVKDICGSRECIELYRYDDNDGSIECVSCLQGGMTDELWASELGGLGVSVDGDTIAFSTRQALVPEDVNNAVDVYEWRNGVQRLITDGETKFVSGNGVFGQPTVRGIDAGGDTILFSATAGPLTGYEQDGLANLYAARVGGGFPRPEVPVHCAEDSCQGSLVAPPSAQSQASSTYEGRGNLAPQARNPRKPCARKRGKAKRACMKRQRKAKAKARGAK